MVELSNGIVANGIDNQSSEPQPTPSLRKWSAATQAIHADDHLNRIEDVAPPVHVATTFRYHDDPDQLVPSTDLEVHSQFNPPILLRKPTNLSNPRLPSLIGTFTPATPPPQPRGSKRFSHLSSLPLHSPIPLASRLYTPRTYSSDPTA